jgi:flagellar assembly factor FliW
MLLESERLGPIEVDEADIVDLPAGLLGFESASRFALVAADEVGAYSWLHSVEDPGLAFLTVVPAFFFPEYAPDVPDDDVEALELTDPSDAQVYCLVTISGDEVTANLLGPVVLNVHNRTARQVVLMDQGWTTKEPLVTR